MAFSRRNFLKYAAMSAGGTVLADTPFLSARARAEAEGGNVKYVPTSCEMCFWKCGVIAKVVPQMNILIVAFPLKIGVGLYFFGFSLEILLYFSKQYVTRFPDILTLIMRLARV